MGLDLVADLAGHPLNDGVEGAEVRHVDGLVLGQHGQDVLVQVLAHADGKHLVKDLLGAVQRFKVLVVRRGSVGDGDQNLLGVPPQGGAHVVNHVGQSRPCRGSPASLPDGGDLPPDVIELLAVVFDVIGADGVPDLLPDVPEELDDVQVQGDFDLGRLEGLDHVDDPLFQGDEVSGGDRVGSVHEEDQVDGVTDGAFWRGSWLQAVGCCHDNLGKSKAPIFFMLINLSPRINF